MATYQLASADILFTLSIQQLREIASFLTDHDEFALLLLSTPGTDHVTDVAPRVRALHVTDRQRVVAVDRRSARQGASVGTDPLDVEGSLSLDATREGDRRSRREGDDAGRDVHLGHFSCSH